MSPTTDDEEKANEQSRITRRVWNDFTYIFTIMISLAVIIFGLIWIFNR